MTTIPKQIQRGEVWQVRFDPTIGDEIRKERPAIVISLAGVGRLRVRIVVPITTWDDRYVQQFWKVFLQATPANGLTKNSAADTIQVKSVSEERFVRKLGDLDTDNLEAVVAGVALCIGFNIETPTPADGE